MECNFSLIFQNLFFPSLKVKHDLENSISVGLCLEVDLYRTPRKIPISIFFNFADFCPIDFVKKRDLRCLDRLDRLIKLFQFNSLRGHLWFLIA